MSYFVLGGIEVPIECFADFNQSYEGLTAAGILRMSDGTGIKQTAWNDKIKIQTSGNGWAPVGLTGLDFEQSMLFKCAIPRAIDDATINITLPTTRRTDINFTPLGFAVVNNSLVETTINIVSNDATLGAVSGATAYRVHYWPELTVFVTEPPENWARSGNSFDWSFEAEQV